MKPTWLTIAESYIGAKEISGPKHNPTITNFWKRINLSGISNDEVPWCAAFVGAVLTEANLNSTHSGLAKSYLKYGTPTTPSLGCIVVFSRSGGGHVGFLVGKNKSNDLFILGGNQSDAVNIKLFKSNNVVGYRWPLSNEAQIPPPLLATTTDYETKVT